MKTENKYFYVNVLILIIVLIFSIASAEAPTAPTLDSSFTIFDSNLTNADSYLLQIHMSSADSDYYFTTEEESIIYSSDTLSILDQIDYYYAETELNGVPADVAVSIMYGRNEDGAMEYSEWSDYSNTETYYPGATDSSDGEGEESSVEEEEPEVAEEDTEIMNEGD